MIACAIIAGVFEAPEQAIIILLMIAISVILGFYNEYKAERIVENLRQNVAIKAMVYRDGKSSQVDSKQLVPGDLASVHVGDIAPADMRLVKCNDLQADEATFTGESFPVEKNCEPVPLERPTPQQLANYLFMGSVVMHGAGQGVVVSTGKSTQLGAISKSLTRSHPETEFQRGVRQYGTMLMTLTLALTITIFGLMSAVGKSVIDSLLFSLAVAVGLVPELMPAIVTISLARGASRMAKAKVVVKRLVSIEDFGNMSVFCTDKTGTLTEGKVGLDKCLSLGDKEDKRVLDY